MEALSRREEEEVMENAKKHALKSCDELVKGECVDLMSNKA